MLLPTGRLHDCGDRRAVGFTQLNKDGRLFGASARGAIGDVLARPWFLVRLLVVEPPLVFFVVLVFGILDAFHRLRWRKAPPPPKPRTGQQPAGGWIRDWAKRP